ncbi:hypothetical protein BDR26DRAFT_897593 [Obelidium mucronatum]|nr:hypothetical protein BDR26DRAFT_897593 [Obelidium mucronatum]
MSKDSQGVYSSASTLRDELETLDSAKTRLVRQFGSISTQPIARHRTLNSQNPMTRSNSISERIGALSIKDINEDPVCRKKSYRNDASLDAKESERALKYMERYNKCKSGKRRETALKHEWNSSTNLSSSNLAHRIPAMTRSSKTPLSTSQSTLVMNPEESTERLTSHSSSVSSNDESETRIEHEPLQSDQLNGLGNRAFSFVDIKQAPSLTSLSKIQPDHATLAASVHVTNQASLLWDLYGIRIASSVQTLNVVWLNSVVFKKEFSDLVFQIDRLDKATSISEESTLTAKTAGLEMCAQNVMNAAFQLKM